MCRVRMVCVVCGGGLEAVGGGVRVMACWLVGCVVVRVVVHGVGIDGAVYVEYSIGAGDVGGSCGVGGESSAGAEDFFFLFLRRLRLGVAVVHAASAVGVQAPASPAW